MIQRKTGYLVSITRKRLWLGSVLLKPFRKVAVSSLEEGYKKYYNRKLMRYEEK